MDPLDPQRGALVADLGQLLMAAACWEHGLEARATFELDLAALPDDCGFLLAAGVDDAREYVRALHFDGDAIRYLRSLYALHGVRREFWDWLGALRFSGDLWAPPEGTPVFAGEPVLRVVAPPAEGLLLGAYLRSMVGYASLVATRAARMAEAARGKLLIETAARLAPGPASGALAARAAYLAGAAGTTSVEAGHELGVPVYALMGQAFVAAFGGADEAFRAWQELHPGATAVALDPREPMRDLRALAEAKLKPWAARISAAGVAPDELARLAGEARRLLDEAGLERVKLLASGGLDEHGIAALVAAGAPIDGFAVGAALGAPAGLGALEARFTLVDLGREGAPRPRQATRAGRPAVLPGVKQVYRRFGTDGVARGDLVALEGESQLGAPVLGLALKDGAPAAGRSSLETIRVYTLRAIERLPEEVRRLREPAAYPVALSQSLEALGRAQPGAGAEAGA